MTSMTAPSNFLRYITPVEAAKLIGVTTAEIWQLIRARHLRWRTFMRMAGKSIDENLADRLAVEMYSLGGEAVRRMKKIERAIHTTRAELHRKVRQAISQLDNSPQQETSDTIELV